MGEMVNENGDGMWPRKDWENWDVAGAVGVRAVGSIYATTVSFSTPYSLHSITGRIPNRRAPPGLVRIPWL